MIPARHKDEQVERDSTRQAADLAAMRRMLEVSEGCFSLSFAVCNDRTLRNELIERLRNEFANLAIVDLSAETTDIYHTVREQLDSSRIPADNFGSDATPSAVFILDLESNLPSEAETYLTLRSLNSSRELWERLSCPVVFWLAEHSAALVARLAPDFWRYRSHQFEFVSDRVMIKEAVAEPFRGFELVDALPFEERAFRIAELEARLREASSPISAELLPHALNWMYELGHLYREAGNYDRAQGLLENAVGCAESVYGKDDTRSADAINNLVHLLFDSNQLEYAEEMMQRALTIKERALGTAHPGLLIYLNNLAQILKATSRLTDAERLIRRALTIAAHAFGPEHPDLARPLNSLGVLLHEANRFAEAESVIPKVATGLNNLAILLSETGRLAEAQSLLQRALAIDEHTFGPNHPMVANRLNNLAHVLHMTNRLPEAESLIRRAIAIEEHNRGPDHPEVAARLNNLAILLQGSNRQLEAEPLLRRALTIDEKSFGPDHPKVAGRLTDIALLLRHTNRIAQAEPTMWRAVAILAKYARTSGHEHPNSQAALRNYRQLLAAMGRSKSEIEAAVQSALSGASQELPAATQTDADETLGHANKGKSAV